MLENKNNSYKVQFGKTSDAKKLVSIKKDGYEISWNINSTSESRNGILSTDTVSSEITDGASTVNVENSTSTAENGALEQAGSEVQEPIQESTVSQSLNNDLLKTLNSTEVQVIPENTEYLNTLSQEDKKRTLTNLTSTVQFKNIYQDVDLEYEVRPEDVKETIVLNKKVDNAYFQFNIKSNGLIPKLQKDKSIIFYDAKSTSKEVFVIDSPYMVDGKNNFSRDIEVNIKETTTGYILSLKPNKEWLNSSERIFPVKIDPTIGTTLDRSSINVGTQNLITNNYEARTGKLLDSTYGNGQIVAYSYDSADRVISSKYNGLDRFKYSYDASGNVANHEDIVNGVNYRYIYDTSDRLVKIVDSKGNTAGYNFDVESNLSSFTESLNGLNYTTSYTYDKENKPKTKSYNGNIITNNYDVLGRLKSKVTTKGTAQFNTIYEFEAGKDGSTTNRVSKITNNGKDIIYSYDNNGNIATITENGKVIKYFYNELNELTREEYYNNTILEKTITYSYDNGGNILNKVETVGVTNTTTTYAYGDANWKDKLTSFNGKAITYDGYTYTWEQGRQLAGMTGNGKTITYKYNDSGIRTQKTVNGVRTNYHLVGDKVTFETNGTDNIYYTYDASDSLVSMNLNGVEYYYIRNNQGDIIGLYDSAGVEVVSYSYDSWGKLVSIDGTKKDSVGAKNPYRYRSYRYDTETSLYYLQSRYYNADWGRFINGDALIGEIGELLVHNMFAYCEGNPMNYSNPTGYAKTTDADGSGGGRGVGIKASDVSFAKFSPSKSYSPPKVSLPNLRNAFSRMSSGKTVDNTTLNYLKNLIRYGKVKDNNIISQIDNNTQIIFRKDTGKNAHPIKPNYKQDVDHYNIEIQTKTPAGKWKSKESYHIILDTNGKIMDHFK